MVDLSIREAVKLKVEQFVADKQPFSIYDITQSIRSDVNSGLYSIAYHRVYSMPYVYAVEHAEVKDKFYDLHNDGEFKLRSYNAGGYLLWEEVSTPASVGSGYYQPPTSNVDESEIKRRIKLYLTNCWARNVSPTLKMVRNSMKRGRRDHGVHISDIGKFIDEMGYSKIIKRR